MQKIKRHFRCPRCFSLNTKRHGKRSNKQGKTVSRKQRWRCKTCHHVFTPSEQPKSSLRRKATELYFDSGASYRAVARHLGLHKMTAYGYIQELASNCKEPWETSKELSPQWEGFLVIDGDFLRVAKRRYSLLIGVDAKTQDIPDALLAPHEDARHWIRFLNSLDRIEYPVKGITSDADPAIQAAVRAVLPHVPYQLCVRHFFKGLIHTLRYRLTQKRGYWRENDRLLEAAHQMLYAHSFAQAKQYLTAICIDPGFKKAGLFPLIEHIEAHFSQLTQHHFYPGMPRTNNIAEGVISRLDAKINRTGGFEFQRTAWATLKMLIMWYRFKKFTDCRKPNKQNNGKCPLEIAKVDASNIDWITFSQKSIRHHF